MYTKYTKGSHTLVLLFKVIFNKLPQFTVLPLLDLLLDTASQLAK